MVHSWSWYYLCLPPPCTQSMAVNLSVAHAEGVAALLEAMHWLRPRCFHQRKGDNKSAV